MLTAGLGSLIGFLLALTGAGGGILSVPMLMFGLGLSLPDAAPVALFAVAIAAAIGAVAALRRGLLRYRAAGFMAITGMIVAPLGVWSAHRIPAAPLAALFGVVLAWVAQGMYRRATKELDGGNRGQAVTSGPRACVVDPATRRLVWTMPCAGALGLTGTVAGFLSGLLGVGGGFVIVPALRGVTNLDVQSIVATSLGVIALVSASGVASASLAGAMQWQIAVPFAAGAIAGMLIGRRLAGRLSGPRLQQGFAIVSGVVAILMVARAGLVL